MELPDRHDQEVAAHQQRQDRAQARYDKLVKEADALHDEEFDRNLRLDNEWLIEAMIDAEGPLNEQFRAAERDSNYAEMGRIMALMIDRARFASREHCRQAGVDKLNN